VSRPPDLSVIVVNFNGRDVLPACLESIPAGIETVVIDNGSTDGSADEIASRFPTVTLIRNRVNRGFAAAVNQGIASSRGRYLCFLNSDARLSSAALSTLTSYLDAHPDAGIVAPQLLHEDGRKQNSFDNFPSFATVVLNKSLLRLLFPSRFPSKKQEFTEPRDVESVIGACMVARRELIDLIGRLDESYFLFLEETDWCLRAREAGRRVVFVPGATVVHLQGRSRDKVRFRAKIEYTRSLFTFLRKNRPVSNFWVRVLHPLKTFAEFVFGVFGLLSARGRRRWVETAALLGWQLCGCPRGFGLSMASEPRYLTLRDNARVLEEHMGAFNDFENKTKQQKVIKDLRNKRTVEYAPGGKTYMVKMYKVDSFGRKVAAALAGSKARHEFERSLDLERRGIPAVRIVAMKDSGDLRWVASEKLEGWEQLQSVLLSEATPAARRRRLCFDYGKFARRLHDAGVWQYDFNPSNVLVRDREMLLIDFERVKMRPRALPAEERYYLLAKMNRLTDLSRTDRRRFLKGYLAAHVLESRQPKLAATEILRRGARQAEVDADRTEERCVLENRDFAPFEIGDVTGHYLKSRPERARAGLTLDEVRALAEAGPANGAFRVESVEDVIEEWKRANRRQREGGPSPVAVLLKRGERRGRIVYRV
jgi:GT2 family glycosyltransferase/tRNA A-37 threonylcarbamoyl transferase component Bud32